MIGFTGVRIYRVPMWVNALFLFLGISDFEFAVCAVYKRLWFSMFAICANIYGQGI